MRWHLILQNVTHLKLILPSKVVQQNLSLNKKTKNKKPKKIWKKFKFLLAKTVKENLQIIGNDFKNVKSISFPFAYILDFGDENENLPSEFERRGSILLIKTPWIFRYTLQCTCCWIYHWSWSFVFYVHAGELWSLSSLFQQRGSVR